MSEGWKPPRKWSVPGFYDLPRPEDMGDKPPIEPAFKDGARWFMRDSDQRDSMRALPIEVKPATPCDGCERRICHNHGSYHIPGCWPCVRSDRGHTGFECLCDRAPAKGAK